MKTVFLSSSDRASEARPARYGRITWTTFGGTTAGIADMHGIVLLVFV